MKLTMAILVYVIIGVILGLGILAVMKGSYWLLIAGILAYILAFAKIGCSEH